MLNFFEISTPSKCATFFLWTFRWRGYENANFVAGSSNPFNANNVSGISCWRNGDKITKSLRFMGPSDTSTSAISAYNGVPNSGDHYSGIEVIVLATEYEASFDFAPSGLLITGMSNWTAFYERNFTGPSTCFIPTSEIYTVSLGTFQVLSVRLGCNWVRKFRFYIYDFHELETQMASNNNSINQSSLIRIYVYICWLSSLYIYLLKYWQKTWPWAYEKMVFREISQLFYML